MILSVLGRPTTGPAEDSHMTAATEIAALTATRGTSAIKTSREKSPPHESSSDRPRARRITDACRALGVSRSHLYALASKGQIRLVHIGGRTVVPESEIDRLVEGAR